VFWGMEPTDTVGVRRGCTRTAEEEIVVVTDSLGTDARWATRGEEALAAAGDEETSKD
jgi:hypothetical protein